jgi:hypothetical protein
MPSQSFRTGLKVLSLLALLTADCAAYRKDKGFVMFQGLRHSALGNARLTIKGDTLVLSNLGSTGEDGVLIELASTVKHWYAEWTPLDDRAGNAPADGAYLALTSRGTINGVENQVIGTARSVDAGKYIEISADYKAIGGRTFTAIIFDGGRDGKAVARAPGQTEVAGQRIRWPFSGHVSGNNGIAIDFDWRGFRDRITLGDGSSAEGDYLCTIPDKHAATVGKMVAVAIQTKGISALVLTSERVTSGN